MSVTNYINNRCRYNYSKLKNVVYLVSKYHVKDIHVDGYDAYIEDLDELPLRLNGFNISLNEETSLDERYEFQKTVTLSMHGYVSRVIGDRFYVILESEDGTKWMVNPDFPARVTYTFNLSNNTNQTDFTFSLLSNFPTLRLQANFEVVNAPCMGYNSYGIKDLKLLERAWCDVDVDNGNLYTYGKDFQDVEFIRNSCSLSVSYDGFDTTSTINFQIPFDDYKTDWQYNLLEFMFNKYAAVITPKSDDNTFFVGFNTGLQANYTIDTDDGDGSDIINIILTETAKNGIYAMVDYSEESMSETSWHYAPEVGYECVGRGEAKYLVQSETTVNGLSTGEYKVLEGYQENFPDLNIVGTFSTTDTFNTAKCQGTSCFMQTDIPLNITFSSVTCSTYNFKADCDWEITDLSSFITVSPSSGEGGTNYTLTVCNTSVSATTGSFNIQSGDNIRIVNVTVNNGDTYIIPTSANIDCTAQNVTFTFQSGCVPSAITSNYTYQVTDSQIIFNVPANTTTSTKVEQPIVYDCNGEPHTLTINQDKVYEDWRNTPEYLCESGNSYVRQQRYTGTTSTSINTPTSEYRIGSLIQSGDTRCQTVITRWVDASDYICQNGDKWSYQKEQTSVDDGATWTDTGVTRLKELIEQGSTDCQEPITYKWVLTELWQCE